jgi:hypothetical protein
MTERISERYLPICRTLLGDGECIFHAFRIFPIALLLEDDRYT